MSDSPGRTDGPVLALTRVSKTYRTRGGSVTALRDVTLDVRPGECVAIMGPSGSGKSTLLSLAGGLLDPDDGGSASACGQDWRRLRHDRRVEQRRRSVGFVFQGLNLVSILSVAENVMLPLLLEGTARARARAAADEVLAALGLHEHARRWPHELSGGQQQRVAIARALAGRQPLLLADEPTGALDSHNSRLVFQTLRRHAAEGGASLVVTHDPLVAEFATRTVRIADGELRAA